MAEKSSETPNNFKQISSDGKSGDEEYIEVHNYRECLLETSNYPSQQCIWAIHSPLESKTYNKTFHLSTKYNTKQLWYRVSNENQADSFSSSKTGNGIGMFVINLLCGL